MTGDEDKTDAGGSGENGADGAGHGATDGNSPAAPAESSVAQKPKTIDASMVFLGVVAVICIGFAGWIVRGRMGGGGGGSAVSRVVVIDVASIEKPYIGLISKRHGVSVTGLGHALGRAVQGAASRYADAGFTVLDGAHVLAVPADHNITAAVRKIVAQDLKRQNAAWVVEGRGRTASTTEASARSQRAKSAPDAAGGDHVSPDGVVPAPPSPEGHG